MKVKHRNVLLFLVYVIKQISARDTSQISNVLENLHLSGNKSPMILVLSTKNEPRNEDSSEFDIYTGDDGPIEDVDDDNPKEEAKYLLYDYLLRTGDPQNTEEEIEDDRKSALREALRSHCQARVECEEKCTKKEKRKNKCPVNCKAVFDRLNLCEPPKKKKCNEEDRCGNRGKTMPPKWF